MPGMTSELYTDQSKSGSAEVLAPPPTPPTPVPPPTKVEVVSQPVTTKARMADEGPDGKVRDTSTEALRQGNDLGFRNITEEDDNQRAAALKAEQDAKDKEAAKPAETKPAEVAKPETATPSQEKVYAGKFKSVEDLEKSYQELESRNTKAMQEAAELRKQQAVQQTAPPPAKTPAQLAAEEARKTEILQAFVADPEAYVQKNIVEKVMTSLAAQEMTNQWRKENPDLIEYEDYVTLDANKLIQSDPELAKDPVSLFKRATETSRARIGKIRSEGAKEALTQETRVIPLLSPTPTASTEQPSQAKAPLTSDQAFDSHLKMLKDEEARSHRGLRR